MKIYLTILSILALTSCNNEIKPDKASESENQVEIYQSTENSFQKDFYLMIEDENVCVNGWEVTKENDTIYYKSNGKLEIDSAGTFRISLERCEYSRVKADHFDGCTNKILKSSTFSIHNGYTGKKINDNSFEFLAVKSFYLGRADKFIFRRIKTKVRVFKNSKKHITYFR